MLFLLFAELLTCCDNWINMSAPQIRDVTNEPDLSEDESEYETDEEEETFWESLDMKSHAQNAYRYARMAAVKGGQAAWILASSFIVLGFPLIISMEREAAALEMEAQMRAMPGGGAYAQQGQDGAARSGIPAV